MSIETPIPRSEGHVGIAAAAQALVSADLAAPPTPTEPLLANQVAALCWRMHKGRIQVLMVTSRETGRWVLPKGWPMTGMGPEMAAAREAWEEAGVEGKVAGAALGFYTYDKILPTRCALPCAVEVFALRVRALKARFPESKQRRRKWFVASEAMVHVAEPGLALLFQQLAEDPALVVPAAGRGKRPKPAQGQARSGA